MPGSASGLSQSYDFPQSRRLGARVAREELRLGLGEGMTARYFVTFPHRLQKISLEECERRTMRNRTQAGEGELRLGIQDSNDGAGEGRSGSVAVGRIAAVAADRRRASSARVVARHVRLRFIESASRDPASGFETSAPCSWSRAAESAACGARFRCQRGAHH